MRKPRVAPSSATRPRRDVAAPAAIGGPWTLPHARARSAHARAGLARAGCRGRRAGGLLTVGSPAGGWAGDTGPTGVGRAAHRPRHRSQGCELPMPSRSLRGRCPRPAELNSRRFRRRRPTSARLASRSSTSADTVARTFESDGWLACRLTRTSVSARAASAEPPRGGGVTTGAAAVPSVGYSCCESRHQSVA